MRRRRQLFVALVAVVLVSASAVIAGYIYASRPVQSPLEIIAKDRAIPSVPEMGLMILCPRKAGEMGLCTLDERDLFTKYTLTVDAAPPPRGDVSVSCRLVLLSWKIPPLTSPAMAWVNLTTIEIDKTSDFTCSHTRIGESNFELDLALIADPDDPLLIAEYFAEITINYDKALLPFGLLTRSVIRGVGAAPLCSLGYAPERSGPSLFCEETAFKQRQTLLEISTQPNCLVHLASVTAQREPWKNER